MDNERLLKLVELTPDQEKVANRMGISKSLFSAMAILEAMGRTEDQLAESYLHSLKAAA